MILKIISLLLVGTGIIFSQSSAENVILPGKEFRSGARADNVYRGVSFIVPRDWNGAMPPDQRMFVMKSDRKIGLGIGIFQSGMSQADLIAYLKKTQNLGDNVILKPVGEPQVGGNKITMTYTSMTHNGMALAMTGPYQNSVLFLFSGPLADKGYQQDLLAKLARSVQFFNPEPARLADAWKNALSGRMLKKISAEDRQGKYPSEIHLCDNGKLQVALPADPANVGNSGTLLEGEWAVEVREAQAVLMLRPLQNQPVQVSLDVFGSYVILQGAKYFLQESRMCQ